MRKQYKKGDYLTNTFQKGSIYVVVLDDVAVPGGDVGPGVVVRNLEDQKLYALTEHTANYYYEPIDEEAVPFKLLSALA